MFVVKYYLNDNTFWGVLSDVFFLATLNCWVHGCQEIQLSTAKRQNFAGGCKQEFCLLAVLIRVAMYVADHESMKVYINE